MRNTFSKRGVNGAALVFMACVFIPPAHAVDFQDGHAMAQQFANAHKTKPVESKPENAIEPKEVEGAVKVRRQESELKTTDQILDSIEARTKAIESLLAQSASDKWDVRAGKPDSVVIQSEPAVVKTETAATPDVSKPDQATEDNGPWAATTSPTLSTTLDPALNVQDTDNAPVEANAPVHAESNDLPEGTASDTIELPQPGYALGGPENLRQGLTEAADILSTATVLLIMKPGNKGLRRFKKTADPVLCGRRNCYMSQGFDKKAHRMPRGATLGPYNTLGRRAGACRQKLTCAFRHVDLMDDGVLLQPVDLKFMRHDRRAYRNLKADTSCRLFAGRLHCANPVKAKTWTAWVVPEDLARRAGLDGLKTALEDGLPAQPVTTVQVKRPAGATAAPQP